MADLRDFIPAVKYGASLQNSKLDSAKVLIGNTSNLGQERSFGTVRFDQGNTMTGTFTISDPSILLGTKVVGSSGSPVLYPLELTQAGATVTWVTHTPATGTITHEAIYLPY